MLSSYLHAFLERPIRRTLYAALFGISATSVWHPQRTLDIAATGFYHTKSSLSNIPKLWERSGDNITEKVQEEELKERESENLKDGSSDGILTEEFVVIENTDIKEVSEDVKGASTSGDEAAASLLEVEQLDTDVNKTVSDADNTVQLLSTDVSEAIPIREEDNTVQQEEPVQVDLKIVGVQEIEPYSREEEGVIKNDSDVIAEDTKIEGDYGQSSPEDQDMYSTRSAN